MWDREPTGEKEAGGENVVTFPLEAVTAAEEEGLGDMDSVGEREGEVLGL